MRAIVSSVGAACSDAITDSGASNVLSIARPKNKKFLRLSGQISSLLHPGWVILWVFLRTGPLRPMWGLLEYTGSLAGVKGAHD